MKVTTINQKKPIKIYFTNMNGANPRSYFPTRLLFENFNIKEVTNKEEADVIFGTIIRGKHKDYINESKKNILLCAENLYAQKNLLSFFESFFHKVLGDKKYILIDFLDNVLPRFLTKINISYTLKGYIKLLDDIKNKKIKNTYVILSNEKRFNSPNLFVFPFFLQERYDTIKDLQKIKPKKEIPKKFCAIIVSSNSSRERIHFLKKLSQYKKVDSYGKVMNSLKGQLYNSTWNCNPNLPLLKKYVLWNKPIKSKLQKNDSQGWYANPELFNEYKFVMCFENGFEEEYITEKLTTAMFSSAIPIYRGPKNIKNYFNTKSFINYNDFGSNEEVIKKIIELDQNDKKYMQMKKEPFFKKNKLPKIFNEKKVELLNFYRKILKDLT